MRRESQVLASLRKHLDIMDKQIAVKDQLIAAKDRQIDSLIELVAKITRGEVTADEIKRHLTLVPN